MNADDVSRLFLRTMIPRLRLTEIGTGAPPRDDGAIQLDARLCWAGGLAEYEQVEIVNLTRGRRDYGFIRFGAPGQVRHALSEAGIAPGDVVRISAYGWLSPEATVAHSALIVNVDEQNVLTEFRRITPRLLQLDPRSFAPSPAIETIVEIPRRTPTKTDA